MVGVTPERVPALLIGLLDDAGKLPHIPRAIEALGQSGTPRAATLEEVAALTWVVTWEGQRVDAKGFRKASGVAAYRDVYDYHTGTDVREIIHLAGSRRAVVGLVRHLRDEARAAGRRLLGCVDCENLDIIGLLVRMGGAMTRITVEDVGA